MKERVHRREVCKNVYLRSEFRKLQNSRKTHDEPLKKERCARRDEQDLAKDVFSRKEESKGTFYCA